MSENKLIKLEKAMIFATHAHSGMLRKGTSTPYILHLMETTIIAGTMTGNVNIMAAAVGQDEVVPRQKVMEV